MIKKLLAGAVFPLVLAVATAGCARDHSCRSVGYAEVPEGYELSGQDYDYEPSASYPIHLHLNLDTRPQPDWAYARKDKHRHSTYSPRVDKPWDSAYSRKNYARRFLKPRREHGPVTGTHLAGASQGLGKPDRIQPEIIPAADRKTRAAGDPAGGSDRTKIRSYGTKASAQTRTPGRLRCGDSGGATALAAAGTDANAAGPAKIRSSGTADETTAGSPDSALGAEKGKAGAENRIPLSGRWRRWRRPELRPQAEKTGGMLIKKAMQWLFSSREPSMRLN